MSPLGSSRPAQTPEFARSYPNLNSVEFPSLHHHTPTMASVFVSGATGYIAQHICKMLLAKGYKVVGTVRTPQKGEHLAKLFQTDNFVYEVVPDVQTQGAFDAALQKHPEVTVFMHTASPFHFNVTDVEKDLLFPAVHGTQNALSAILAHGKQVRNVVVTSSYAAISTAALEGDASHTNTEESWNNITWEESKTSPHMGYRGLKKFAEKAAWDFVAEKKPPFVITYVNPVFVFGPQAFDSEVKDNLNTSAEMVNSLLALKPDSPVPAAKGGFVDVRDVAKAHLVAFEKNLPNQRLLLAAGRFCGQDFLDVVNANFPSLQGKLPVGEPGAGAKVNAAMCTIDASKTKEILGFPLIDLKTSVVDTIAQILKNTKSNL